MSTTSPSDATQSAPDYGDLVEPVHDEGSLKHSIQKEAALEAASKTRFGVLYYLFSVLLVGSFSAHIPLSSLPSLSILSCLLLLAIARELAYRRIQSNAQQAHQLFWIISANYIATSCLWTLFVLYAIWQEGSLSAAVITLFTATAGFTTGATLALVPHLKTIRVYLVLMILAPAPFWPMLLNGGSAWQLLPLNVVYFIFLFVLSQFLCRYYWKSKLNTLKLQARTQELEQLNTQIKSENEAKSLFLAHMSHEIRTPMNGILGMLQLMDEESTPPEFHHRVDVMRSSSETLLAIVNDILDHSKLESGLFTLHPCATDIAELTQSVADFFEPQAQAKGIELEFSITTGTPPLLYLDPHRLKQILFNLAGNAVKNTQQGKIHFAVTWEPSNDSQVQLTLAVSDTGVGISEGDICTLFEDYQQTSGAAHQVGTGLGLSICKQLAELMGGEIEVTSELGVGSCFSVRLLAPIATEEQKIEQEINSEASLSTKPSTQPLSNNKILVVEDNQINQTVIVSMLEQLGYAAEVTDNGYKALTLRQQQDYAAILMDCDMPILSGTDTCRLIRDWEQQQQQSPTTIIALTAHVLDMPQTQCLEAGMNAILSKPVKLQKLQEALPAL